VVATKELTAMDPQLVETTIKAYLTEIRSRLDKAAGIGRAADACAGAGFHEKGLESRTRYGATLVRGNNIAECGEPDQPDQSTKLRVLF
jgi:hypothetical protein